MITNLMITLPAATPDQTAHGISTRAKIRAPLTGTSGWRVLAASALDARASNGLSCPSSSAPGIAAGRRTDVRAAVHSHSAPGVSRGL